MLAIIGMGLGFLWCAPSVGHADVDASTCSATTSNGASVVAASYAAVANDDSDNEVYVAGMTVPVNILSNDTHDLPINEASIDLDPSQSGIQQTVTNSNGTWSVQSDGTLNFMPSSQGSAQITYNFSLNNGQVSNNATVTVTTHGADTMAADDDLMPYSPDNGITDIGSINIVANDSASAGHNLDLNSVDIEPQVAGIQHSYTIRNTTIRYDPTTGDVHYYASSIPGEYPTITYTIADESGNRSNVATVNYVYGVSDVRLKRTITFLKRTADGINLYSFQYLNSDQVYVGVLAQQVMLTHPSAVILMPNGYYEVNYRELGLHFETLQRWEAGH